MTDDGGARVSSDETQTRQRKKRKWDQPAESFVAAAAAGLIVPGILPLSNLGSLAAVMVPGTSALTTTLLASPMVASSKIVSSVIPVASPVQQSSMVNSKLNQVKIQEDLVIAREIVINDAESSLRYRLTKRQTQEEILNRTGAVVITRGKYRPPNTPSDEKPLYLHISAAAHLKETVERIVAVDRAAAMIEDMMKQGPNFQFPLPNFPMTNGVQQAGQSLSVCIYLGFDVDPSWNIAARIRGPNDLYISHIMNETGATVLLKGRGSGALEGPHGEGEQPLHLFLSSNNKKSLDDAKSLAENLLDTISAEYGASRVSSSKAYGAVPPPPQLLPATEIACKPHMNAASAVSSSSVGPITAPAVSSSALPIIGNYMQPPLTGGTSYRGYEGIYPQATPLQQVALALKQSPSVTSSIVPTATPSVSIAAKSSTSTVPEKEKKPPQRRKFQELPAGPSVSTKITQGPELANPDTGARDFETMLPKRLVPSSSNGNLPPSRPALPSSPKLTSVKPIPEVVMSKKIDGLMETRPDPVPDTLLKLVEYGEEEDDLDETVQDSTAFSIRKPFWAV